MIRFNRRVAFQCRQRQRDPDGNVLQGWEDIGSLWASVRETPGREAITAGRLEASHTATVWLRDGPTARGLTPADRMIFRGLAWDIRSAHPCADREAVIELLVEVGTE